MGSCPDLVGRMGTRVQGVPGCPTPPAPVSVGSRLEVSLDLAWGGTDEGMQLRTRPGRRAGGLWDQVPAGSLWVRTCRQRAGLGRMEPGHLCDFACKLFVRRSMAQEVHCSSRQDTGLVGHVVS